ncbi:TadE/TadG family type IV pilus assembly protein [Thermaurantiacus tibetensis]|uniref:TadE/TadG family type IV pilus assembly protein n=1 Tax=Thermaurantiacus tibetensis TaxID=2759035 RepID=UPI00188F26FD|nr:TadE/TadG family type IV pilus assembly protein [Thermaurantiacus tibetensis]
MRRTRRTPLRRLGADTRGATAVEFALVSPLLLALVLGGIEAGRYLWFAAALDHAVAAAVRCAEVPESPCGTPAGLLSEINATLERLAVSLTIASAALETAPAPCGTDVRVGLPYPALVPGIAPAMPALAATACIRESA